MNQKLNCLNSINKNDLILLLKEKKRGNKNVGKISETKHFEFIEQCLNDSCDSYLSELCVLFEKEFSIAVSVSTMCRFLKKHKFTRKLLTKTLPKQALTEKNIEWRRKFVEKWFAKGTYDLNKIATNEESDDQKNWRLKKSNGVVKSNKQLFFIDETGCNKLSLLRKYGYSKSGCLAQRRVGIENNDRGVNHSVIIACGVERGVIAHKILVGNVKSKDKRKRGTKRIDFCEFLKQTVGKAMLDSANASGLSRRAPLYLIMDNASIHKGKEVSLALRSVSKRLHVCYQPPYMPTIHPTELINSQLKSNLKHFYNSQSKNTISSEQLSLKICEILKNKIKNFHVENYFQHCGWY